MMSTPGRASGSSTAGTAVAGTAGVLSVDSRGNIHLGQVSAPTSPTLPTAPTSGTVVTTALLAAPPVGFGQEGNLLLSGSVTTPGTGLVQIIASVGDIVVSGSLQAGGAVSPDPILLNAPNGTVYITGNIRTALGLSAGAAGGTLTVTARRIIVTGSIDTRGDPNSAGDGGQGGAVSLDTTTLPGGTSVYALGSIQTSGGTGTTRTTGGISDAGAVTINASDEAWLSGTLTARGGNVSGTTGQLTSGNGGSVTVNGSAGAFLNSTIDLSAGNVSTTGTGTGNGLSGSSFYVTPFTGGQGGQLQINVAGGALTNPSGPVFLFGTFTANGGSASASSGTGVAPIYAGDSGGITIGNPSPTGAPASVELGTPSITLPGGNSSDTASAGGSVTLRNNYSGTAPVAGDIRTAGSINLMNGTGGNSLLLNPAPSVLITAQNGDVSLSGSINLGGGSTAGDGFFLPPSTVTVQAGLSGTEGGIFSSAAITAIAPASTGGTGSLGCTVDFQVQDPRGGISLLPGSLIVVNGGSGSVAGGFGGTVSLRTTSDGSGAGTISISGTISAQGGSAIGGAIGGPGGRLFVDSCTSGGFDGGDVTIETGTVIDLSGANGSLGGYARNNVGGATTATRTPDPNTATCCLEIWTHGSGTTPAEPVFSVASGGRWINNGFIRADGGAPGGAGGDMNIDAFQSDGSGTVTLATLGNVSNAGNAGGAGGIITVH